MLLSILLIVVMFICIALMWTEGFWGNCLTMVNVLFAALIATNYFEPVADFLESRASSFTYSLDFLALWLVFSLSLLILKTATDQTSRHAVRFKFPVEITGGIVCAVITAWIFACFMTATLHTAPLARTALRGSFEPAPLGTSFFGLHPDRYWLSFVHSRSQGALSESSSPAFDEQGDFIWKYAARRHDLQLHNEKQGTTRVSRR